MTSQRKLKIVLVCVLLIVGCLYAFSIYDINHTRQAELFTKTGLCTEMVQYENKFSIKHRGKGYYQVLHFDDGTEFVCREDIKELLPRELTIGYVQTFWLGANGPTVASISDGETIYLSYEDWLAERVARDWRMAGEISIVIVLLALFGSSYDIYCVIRQARRKRLKNRKKVARQKSLAEKRMKEKEVSE